jgi:hypothetical protein
MVTTDRGPHLRVLQVPWTRPALAYLCVVALGVLVFELANEPDLVASVPLGTGLALLAFAGVLLLPAGVAAIALSHRFEAASGVARAALGAASWAGWGLIVAITLAVVSQLALMLGELVSDLAILAAAGAAFSVLGLDGHEVRAGRWLTLVSLVVVAMVIVGSALMAGHWGSFV